ncbi:tetratricopeptide repeat protein [Shewanella sp.]|uniref:tetratricopeptide repeat protein n=1 Tax=Shewanella sp. TaxID=50422 RepID=UPI000E82595A|nr:tetratricopeptide repeat protein [Shewanella sp.]HAY92436.1 nitrite reductase [Shewanella sp.]
METGMVSLGLGTGISLLLFVAYIYWQHMRLNLVMGIAQLPNMSSKVPFAMGIVLVLLTLAIYSQTGRFRDWDQGRIDENIDYLVAAEITKASRWAQSEPQNTLALMSLAQAYNAGGLYSDAVLTLDKLLEIGGDDAEVLGAKANALYYRELRQMTPETQEVIAKALALSPFEPQTHMLLAGDAYLHARNQEAIDHWQLLLKHNGDSINREAIDNAIAKAQSKMNER